MDKTYKLIELVGTSTNGYESAIQNAIEQASKSLKALGWFEVIQLRGGIMDGKVSEYQAIIKVGFKLVD